MSLMSRGELGLTYVQSSIQSKIDEKVPHELTLPQQQEMYRFILELIRDYVNARVKSNNKSDYYKVDSELLIQFQKDLYKRLKNYLSQFDTLIGLEEILEQIYQSEDMNSKLITEIKTAVVKSLKQLIQDKITGEIVGKLKLVNIKQTITNISNISITDDDAERITNQIFNDTTNPNIVKFKNEIGRQVEDYRDKVLQMFKEQIEEPLDRNRYRENAERKKPENKFTEKLKGNIDKGTLKAVDRLVNRIFDLINLSIAQRTVKLFKKSVTWLFNAPMKILKAFKNFMTSIVRGLVTGVFGFVRKFIINPIFFVFNKAYGLLSFVTKGIYKTVKTIFNKTKLHYLLVTPMGMYAIGFILGFIWEKLKKLMPQNLFSIDGVMKFLFGVFEGFRSLCDAIDNQYDWFLAKHPNVEKTISYGKEFIQTWLKDGFLKACENTRLGKLVKNQIDRFKNSALFKTISLAYDVVKDVYTFVIKHPIWTGIIVSAAEFIRFASTTVRMGKMIRAPFGAAKGGIGCFLLGLGTAQATDMILEGVFKMFGQGYTDEKLDLLNKKEVEYHEKMDAIRQDKRGKFKELSTESLRKYAFLKKYMDQEYEDIRRYTFDVEKLNELQKSDEFTNIVGGRLDAVVPNLIRGIMQNDKVSKELQNEWNQIKNAQDSDEQQKKDKVQKTIQFLTKVLNYRQNAISDIADKLSTAESVDDVLKQHVDNSDGNLSIKTGDVLNSDSVERRMKNVERALQGGFDLNKYDDPTGQNPYLYISGDEGYIDESKFEGDLLYLHNIKKSYGLNSQQKQDYMYYLIEHLYGEDKLLTKELQRKFASGSIMFDKETKLKMALKPQIEENSENFAKFFSSSLYTDSERQLALGLMVENANSEQLERLNSLLKKDVATITDDDVQSMHKLEEQIKATIKEKNDEKAEQQIEGVNSIRDEVKTKTEEKKKANQGLAEELLRDKNTNDDYKVEMLKKEIDKKTIT